MFKKAIVFALLFVLVLASFPTNAVFAKDGKATQLEKKWDQLVESYKFQSLNHLNIHKQVDNYIKTHTNLKTADKAELNKHLAICNSALESAAVIVNNHAGFDAKGNVIDRTVAQKTLRTLANILQQHRGSVKNLQYHMQ